MRARQSTEARGQLGPSQCSACNSGQLLVKKQAFNSNLSALLIIVIDILRFDHNATADNTARKSRSLTVRKAFFCSALTDASTKLSVALN